MRRDGLLVKDLFFPIEKKWDEPKLKELFDVESVEMILKILILTHDKLDKIMWVREAKGNFIVGSSYKVCIGYKRVVGGDSTFKKI